MSKKPNVKIGQQVEAALVQPEVVQPEVVQRDPECDGPEFCDGTDAEGFPGGDERFQLEHPSLAAEFVELCQKVNSSLNLNDLLFFQDKEYQDPYEDDGTLHVIDPQTNYRACFDVGFGQTLSRSHQNRNARRVLKRLGIEHLYNDRVQR